MPANKNKKHIGSLLLCRPVCLVLPSLISMRLLQYFQLWSLLLFPWNYKVKLFCHCFYHRLASKKTYHFVCLCGCYFYGLFLTLVQPFFGLRPKKTQGEKTQEFKNSRKKYSNSSPTKKNPALFDQKLAHICLPCSKFCKSCHKFWRIP